MHNSTWSLDSFLCAVFTLLLEPGLSSHIPFIPVITFAAKFYE